MSDRIQILSVNGYMTKYAVNGIGKGADRWQVKRDMLDEFRREIFNQAVWSVGAKVFSDEYEGTEEERKKLTNIIDNANRKWKSLCREFEKYSETSGLLKENDLQDYLEERLDISTESDSQISTARMATEKEIEEMMSEDENDEETEEETDDGNDGTDAE